MDLEKTCWKLHGRVEKEEVFNQSGKGAQKKGCVSDALKDQMIRKNLIIKEYKKEKEDTLKTKVRMQECANLIWGKIYRTSGGLPGGAGRKEHTSQCRSLKRLRFDP